MPKHLQVNLKPADDDYDDDVIDGGNDCDDDKW